MCVGLLYGLITARIRRAPARPSRKHVAVSQEGHASDVGAEILGRGGNAVDAAIATAFALAVTLPEAGNLGGGGFIVAYLAGSQGSGHGRLPRDGAAIGHADGCTSDSDGKPRPRYRTGAWAAGVPGTVRGLGLAHARWGKRPWAELVRPAVRLAREGFPISEDLAGSLNRQLGRRAGQTRSAQRHARRRNDFGRLGDFPESVAALGKPDGAPWQAGDRLIQADLAATLERIAAGGPDEFYTGRTAELIAEYMEEHGGLITLDDLKSYEAKIRAAGPHHVPRVTTSTASGRRPPAASSSARCSTSSSASTSRPTARGSAGPCTASPRRCDARFFTRATQLADPDFVAVPVARADLQVVRRRRWPARSANAATPSAELAPFPIQPAEGDHTTHLSTIDAAGNAVALTYTLEDSYGAKCVVAGAGFLLNNEMGDFNLIPGRTDTRGWIGTPANRIAPPQADAQLADPDARPEGRPRAGGHRLARGAGRSPTRRSGSSSTWLEFGLDPRAAVAAPRTHHQWFPDVLNLEGHAWPKATLEALAGHGTSRPDDRASGECQHDRRGTRRGGAPPRCTASPTPPRTTRAAGD